MFSDLFVTLTLDVCFCSSYTKCVTAICSNYRNSCYWSALSHNCTKWPQNACFWLAPESQNAAAPSVAERWWRGEGGWFSVGSWCKSELATVPSTAATADSCTTHASSRERSWSGPAAAALTPSHQTERTAHARHSFTFTLASFTRHAFYGSKCSIFFANMQQIFFVWKYFCICDWMRRVYKEIFRCTIHTTFDSPGTGSRFHVYTLAPARSADTAASDWSSDAMLRRLWLAAPHVTAVQRISQLLSVSCSSWISTNTPVYPGCQASREN